MMLMRHISMHSLSTVNLLILHEENLRSITTAYTSHSSHPGKMYIHSYYLDLFLHPPLSHRLVFAQIIQVTSEQNSFLSDEALMGPADRLVMR